VNEPQRGLAVFAYVDVTVANDDAPTIPALFNNSDVLAQRGRAADGCGN
jgi:hypothetical protein